MKIDKNSKHFKMTPWDHQLRGIELALPHRNFAWLYEVGTGKSKTAVETLRYVYSRHKKVLRTLIVCPPIVIENWKKEFRMSSNLPSGKVIKLVGTGKQRVDILKGADSDSVFITNYETLLMKPFAEEAAKNPFEVVVADEVHYCKNSSSKRARALYRIGDRALYRYGLTGTPILKSTIDTFGIYRFLDKGERFSNNYLTFRHKYFYDKNAGMPSDKHFPNWQPIPSKEKELTGLMSEISHHVKKSECLDLPPYLRMTVEVGMSPEQTKAYKEMRKDLITFLDTGDKAAVARLGLTKALRLLQITSGFVGAENVDGERSDYVFPNTPREKALKDLLEKLTPDHKVIVWSIFKENYKVVERVCEDLGLEFVEVNGSVSQKNKDLAVERFNNDPSVRVFSGHPVSGGIGINLVSSSYTVYYSRGFSLGADIQSEARNYRGGSEIHEKVTRIDLVSPGTLDEVVLQKLKEKTELSGRILGSLKDRI